MRPTSQLRVRTPALAALAALIAMLGVHTVLRFHDDLSPWKGAGFAMFSTIDSPGLRTVTVWADLGGAEERVHLAGPWLDASRELRSLPTAARTAALARSVASSTLVRHADGNLAVETSSPMLALVPAGGPSASETATTASATAPKDIVGVERVRVDVTKLSYDGGLVRATLVRSVSADVALNG